MLPAHPDFIAEVERVLGVLDGAVLVISVVEGVADTSFGGYRPVSVPGEQSQLSDGR